MERRSHYVVADFGHFPIVIHVDDYKVDNVSSGRAFALGRVFFVAV
jgi:hypothetical protein